MPVFARWSLGVAFALTAGALAAGPATRQADPTMDWLLSQSTTGPATAASEPSATAPSVFTSADDDSARGARQATITFSDGQKISGLFATTPDQPIRIYDNEKKKYRDVPYKSIKSMEAHVLWERDQPEWKFKESGSDVKEFSGKTYPARETEYTLTLKSGETITGAVAAPIYQQRADGVKLFVIHKRDKGDVGQTIKELLYIQRMDFE